MGKYHYQAMAASGESMAGTIEADSPQHAQSLLAAMQVKVYSLEPAAKELPRTRLGRSEFLLFNQQLASITKAGLPLERALRQLSGDVQSARLRRAIGELAADLEGGMPLEDAFARHEKSFPYLYGRIIQAGVRTGRLSEMLTSLNRHLEMAGQTRKILQDALTYPLLVLGLGCIIVTGVMIRVVPEFRKFLGEMRAELTWGTAGLFWFSDNMMRVWTVLGILVLAIVVLRLLLGASEAGRRWWERLILGVPALGRVYHRTHLARLADAMAILIGSGCDLPAAIRLSAGASGSPCLLAECQTLAAAVEQGQFPQSDELGTPHLPAMMIYSIRLGAQRNDLEANLYSLSEMYARQAEHLQGNLQALLLPVLIVALGGLIAFVIWALMGPMLSLITALTRY